VVTVAKEPAAEAQRHTEQVALAAFVSYSLLAGGNAVCIRFSNRELAPLWGAGLRFALAAALLLLVMAVLRLPIPRGRALAGAVLYGALTFAGAFALAYYALVGCTQGSARSSSLSFLSPP
jgi:drug/metabolite transporter (DMT)-like permease